MSDPGRLVAARSEEPEEPESPVGVPVYTGAGVERAEVEADPPPPRPKRIPHLGHALLFVSFTFLLLVVTQAILLFRGQSPKVGADGTITIEHPLLQLATMAATYVLTLVAAWFFFPLMWHRTFLEGIRWGWPSARRQAVKLLGLGVLLGVMVQVITYFIPEQKTPVIDDFFSTQTSAWLITLFGTIVAPVFEEICFRGFLVPAFAIAYDWLSLDRTPQGRTQWHITATLTPAGLIFSAILSSICFALLHAEQVNHAVPALVVLFSVSLVLTFVRVKTQSVAASTLVHGMYNFMVFLTVLFATGGYRHLEQMGK